MMNLVPFYYSTSETPLLAIDINCFNANFRNSSMKKIKIFKGLLMKYIKKKLFLIQKNSKFSYFTLYFLLI